MISLFHSAEFRRSKKGSLRWFLNKSDISLRKNGLTDEKITALSRKFFYPNGKIFSRR